MTKNRLIGIVAALLVLWVVLALIGIIVKGLIWLFVVGLVLFALTAVLGGSRTRR